MLKPREKAIIFLTALCGGLTALFFYGGVIDFSFSLVSAHVSNPWIIGCIIFLFGTLVFGLSIGINTSQYRHVVSKGRINVVSLVVFFIGSMISLYGGSLFALGLLGVIVLILRLIL